jgi:hypothetical protein
MIVIDIRNNRLNKNDSFFPCSFFLNFSVSIFRLSKKNNKTKILYRKNVDLINLQYLETLSTQFSKKVQLVFSR